MVVFDSIIYQTVVSDPPFQCPDTGIVAPEEECEENVGVQPDGQEWQPNDVMQTSRWGKRLNTWGIQKLLYWDFVLANVGLFILGKTWKT